MKAVGAVDLGAASGRVIVGRVGRDRIDLTEVHRFPNDPVNLPDGLHWDLPRLYHDVLAGLRSAGREAGSLISIGVDSWAIDFALFDAGGSLVGIPFHYRDERHASGVAPVHEAVEPPELYDRTGLQFLPFTTIYQLTALRSTPSFAAARQLLLIPDSIGFWLTGATATELTNASTTGLLDVRTHGWARDLIGRIGLPQEILGPIHGPGEILGPLRPEVASDIGLPGSVVVTLVGSHDTASAVLSVPAANDRFAYISLGTWALIGLELDAPILTEASRAANFTNEGGVDGTIRFLRNEMGLWMLQECLRTWEQAGTPEDLATLLSAAAEGPDGPTVDPSAPEFFAPGDMPGRIGEACRSSDVAVPPSRPALVRCVLDSLAETYARTLREACELAGHDVDRIHLVGGGARNELLCQLIADRAGMTVVAGPVEATAMGNVLVQARAHGLLEGDRWALRQIVAGSEMVRTYEPRPTHTHARA